MTAPPVIEVTELVKTYGDRRAVDDISFTVSEGEVVAVLGPNGAGKTTTVEILEGHRDATAGSVQVLGMDPGIAGSELRERIGVVLQTTGIELQLSAREALEVYGSVYRRPRPADELLDLVSLREQADQRVRDLSGGQLRRLDLALGLVGDPDLLFLDEPTTGFDPAARRQSWAMVEDLARLGKTVLLTTHYLEEAQTLADRVLVMRAGAIVAEGTPDELLAGSEQLTRIEFRLPTEGGAVDELLGEVVGDTRGRDGVVEIRTGRPTADLARVCGWAAARGIELEGLRVSEPSLEDIYLELVGGDEAETTSDQEAS